MPSDVAPSTRGGGASETPGIADDADLPTLNIDDLAKPSDDPTALGNDTPGRTQTTIRRQPPATMMLRQPQATMLRRRQAMMLQ